MIGREVNNYRLLALIGEGGMGTVYLASHVAIPGRQVAIKVMRPRYCADAQMVARFMNEARAANAIRHPNIIDVLDVGHFDDGTPYLMMELLAGETLAARLRAEGRLRLDSALICARQLISALAAAHATGIVHRDLKPENVFLTRDEAGQPLVKVLDFGIAKLRDVAGANPVETTGGLLGTPVYMSPEQCRGGGEVDARTDVYALGTLLYEMLCGRPPFASDALGDVLVMQLTAPAPPPRSLNPDIPQWLADIIERALAKDPADRYPGMEAVAQALNDATQAAIHEAPTPPPEALGAPTPAPVLPATAAALPAATPAPEAPAALPTTATAPAATTGSAAEPPVMPGWVQTPTPGPTTPERAPFGGVLAQPRRPSYALLAAGLAAVVAVIVAFPRSRSRAPSTTTALAAERPPVARPSAAGTSARAAVALPATSIAKGAPSAPAAVAPPAPSIARGTAVAPDATRSTTAREARNDPPQRRKRRPRRARRPAPVVDAAAAMDKW